MKLKHCKNCKHCKHWKIEKVKSFFYWGQCLNSTLKASTDLTTEANENILPQTLTH